MSKTEHGKAKTKKKTSDHRNKECPDSMTRRVTHLLNMPIMCKTTEPLEKVKQTKREEPGVRTIWNSDHGQIPGERNCPLDNENRKRLLIANVMLGNVSMVNPKSSSITKLRNSNAKNLKLTERGATSWIAEPITVAVRKST